MRAYGLSLSSSRTISAQSSGWIISSFGTGFQSVIGVYEARADRRRAHAVVLLAAVERVGELDHGRLRGAVHRKERRPHRAGDGGEVDDEPTRLAEQWQRGRRHQHQSAKVHVELKVDLLRRHVGDVAGDPDAGRVDEDVEPAVPRVVLIDDAPAITRVRDVGGDGERVEVARGRLDLLACPGGERELEAVLPQRTGDCAADTRGASGDEGALLHEESLQVRR